MTQNILKLRLKDKVMITAGRDKGKTGEIIAVLPKANQVVVEGLNTVKRHQKPTTQNPRGGIIEMTRPIDASKVAALDPKTNKPARISYSVNDKGVKQRIFKISKFSNSKNKKSTINSKIADSKTAEKQS